MGIRAVHIKGATEKVLVQKRVSHKVGDARTSLQREWGAWRGRDKTR